jgi:hypothetical protein
MHLLIGVLAGLAVALFVSLASLLLYLNREPDHEYDELYGLDLDDEEY